MAIDENNEKWRDGYNQAFEDIISGQTLDETRVKILSGKNKPSESKWTFEDWGKVLTIVTSIAVAISGIVFSGVQIWTGWQQKVREEARNSQELKIKETEAFKELIGQLTSKDPNARRYAFSALLIMQSSKTENLQTLANDLGGDSSGAEAIDIIATRLKNEELKKSAASLYAQIAEKNLDDYDYILEDYDYGSAEKRKEALLRKEELLKEALKAAERANILDPDNFKHKYWRGLTLQYAGKLPQAIQWYEKTVYPKEMNGQPLETKNIDEKSNEFLRTHFELTMGYQKMAEEAKKKNDTKGYQDYFQKTQEQMKMTIEKYQSAKNGYDVYIENREKNEPEFYCVEQWLLNKSFEQCKKAHNF